jgi:hypothetical protein
MGTLSNNSLQLTSDYRGRSVLAMDCVLTGADRVSCPSAELNRSASTNRLPQSLFHD